MIQLNQNLVNNIDITINLEENLKVVLIDTTAKDLVNLNKHLHNANIYCVDNNHNIIWQVDSDSGLSEKDSFVFIEKLENGLKAHRFFGTEYLIDLDTGKSKKTGWNK